LSFAPSQIGSIEFAVEHFGTRMVLLLAHDDCGSVSIIIGELKTSDGKPLPES
tara:strand:- start:622 stop:780 length:159 start_codon:yes stop_codon:yes gene_type:complete